MSGKTANVPTSIPTDVIKTPKYRSQILNGFKCTWSSERRRVPVRAVHVLSKLGSRLQLQQMEAAQLQHQEANLTALAAIGPRKKRALEQPESQVSASKTHSQEKTAPKHVALLPTLLVSWRQSVSTSLLPTMSSSSPAFPARFGFQTAAFVYSCGVCVCVWQVAVLPRPGLHKGTRITLRDLLLVMELEPVLRHSLLLYKAML